ARATSPSSRRRAARRLGTRRSVCSPGPLPHLEPAGGGGPGEVPVGRLPPERPTIPHGHARRGPVTAIAGVDDAGTPGPTAPARRSDRLPLGPHRPGEPGRAGHLLEPTRVAHTPNRHHPSPRVSPTSTPAGQPVNGDRHTDGSPSISHSSPSSSTRSVCRTSGGPSGPIGR